MPARQGGAGCGEGLSGDLFSLSPSSHLPWRIAAGPAAEPPYAAAPCTWLALLGAVHGCSIFRRATSGGRRGALRLAEEPLAIPQHPRPRARAPSPGPEPRPRRRVPVRARGAPWGSRAAHPLSLLGQSQTCRAGGGGARVGRGALGGDSRGRSHSLSRLGAAGGSSGCCAPAGQFPKTPLLSAGRDLPLRPAGTPSPNLSRRHGRIFATRQI